MLYNENLKIKSYPKFHLCLFSLFSHFVTRLAHRIEILGNDSRICAIRSYSSTSGKQHIKYTSEHEYSLFHMHTAFMFTSAEYLRISV